ncbi:hypothetical protein ACIBSW_11605 [Actinoplanes sp. NPDC049668]|uniref:hypothetical protein n=1 Tax=unclassified Actinoplanes TaxID=2626549 RepID=UPI0033A7202E
MTPGEPEDRDSLRVQMQQSIETFRHLTTLFVQCTGFLIAAGGLLFGYGLAQQKAAPLLFAGLAPLGIIVVLMLILSHGLPVAFVAIRSEERLLPGEATVGRTYFMTKYPLAYAWIAPALRMDEDERNRMLARPPLRGMVGARAVVLSLVTGSIAQFVLFFVALIWFDYRFM